MKALSFIIDHVPFISEVSKLGIVVTSTKADRAKLSVVPLTTVTTFDSPCCLEAEEGAGDFLVFFFGGGDFVSLDFLYPTFLNPTLQP
jgi:hypothetical protein